MDLTDDDLYGTNNSLTKMKEDTYNDLYKKCISNIKLIAKKGDLFCFYKIPVFYFGSSYPLINIESCANYIMDKLVRSNGRIRTFFVKPNIILISWDPEHIVYNLLKNNSDGQNQ